MKTILLLGAGRSSGVLIQYLLENAQKDNYRLRVGDRSPELALEKTNGHSHADAFAFDIENAEQRKLEIQNSTIVISLLPPSLHILAAKDCVQLNKSLVTASYVSNEINELDAEAKKRGILLLNECGLDPGIDHMSAMEIIDRLKSFNGEIISFKSYTGGLVAPESNDNPWGYKFTWNPRNVILAGQGTAKFIANGKYHYLPYNRLFSEITSIDMGKWGTYDGYANRDSLSYRKHYGIESIPTLVRGTLRNEGYCKAWDVFVKIGLTDDTFIVEDSSNLTYAELVDAFIPESIIGKSLEDRLCKFCGIENNGEVLEKIIFTGILDSKKIGLANVTPAMILQNLLEKKWVLKEGDKDMIVMQHQFIYKLNENYHQIISSLVVKGDNLISTAMAKTVGLPLGIAARLILKNEIKLTGVALPVHPNIYNPILNELKEIGISFEEETKSLEGNIIITR